MTLIVLLNAIFGISMPISKILIAQTTPFFLTGIRMSTAGCFLLLYEKLKNKKKFDFHVDHVVIFAQIIVLGISASYALRFYALRYLPAGKASFLLNFSPLLSSVYAYIMFREKMTKKQWLGLAIGFIGMIPMLLSTSKEEANLTSFYFISLPELAIILCAALYSYSHVLVQKLVRDYGYSPALVNGVTMGLGGLLSLGISFMVENNQGVALNINFFALLAFLIVASNIVCHTLYAQLLRKYSATFLSFSNFLSPLFSIFYGWSFLNEVVTWHVYVSTVVVMAGLYMFYQDEKNSNAQNFVEEF